MEWQAPRIQFSGHLQDFPHALGIWHDSHTSLYVSWVLTPLYERCLCTSKDTSDKKGMAADCPTMEFFSRAVSEDWPLYDSIQRILIVCFLCIQRSVNAVEKERWKRWRVVFSPFEGLRKERDRVQPFWSQALGKVLDVFYLVSSV